MTKDIRIAFSFLNHRKLKKLESALGIGATKYLINLWINTAMNHPRGRLNGMGPDDIAIDAGFDGDPNEFVSALVATRFIKKSGKIYCIHDWKEHQSFVYHSKERSQLSRKAAVARWEGEKKSDAGGMRAACAKNRKRNAPLPLPLPLPSPNIKPPHIPPKGEGPDGPPLGSKNSKPKKKPKNDKLKNDLQALIDKLNKLMRWRRTLSPGLLKKAKQNTSLDSKWMEKAHRAALDVPRIDDRDWPGGKVRLEWFFQMKNPRREYDPVVDKILNGAYAMRPAPKKSFAEKERAERPVPADPEVVKEAISKARAAMGDHLKDFGKIPGEK